MEKQAGGESKPHNFPISNKDYDFFYIGLEQQTLLIQQCDSCGKLRNPPSPICPSCRSFDWTAQKMSGRGTIFSYVIHYHPPLPEFPLPHVVAVVELEEGIRFTAAMDNTGAKAVSIGTPVRAYFFRRGDIATLRFEPAGGV